jgi:diguanylate cyclase (GGDEF)-like protein
VTLPVALLLAALGTSLWTAYCVRQRPAFPGGGDFLAMQLAGAWWVACALCETVAASPDAKVFWAEMAWPGIVAAPGFWALFLWSYLQGGLRPPRPRWRRITLGIAGLSWVVALTNDWHHLLYVSAVPVDGSPGGPLEYGHGAWFFAITGYLYLVMLATVVLALQAVLRAPALYRQHHLGLLLAVTVPWLANIGYVSGSVRLFDFDPTPFSFVAMGAVFYWLIRRRRFLDLLPVARDALLDGLPDPVLVADAEGIIVDANAAAAGLPGMPDTPLGGSLAAVPVLREALGHLHRADRQGTDRLIAAAGRHYEAEAVPLLHGERRAGLLLLLRDVTRRVEAEARLQEALAALQAEHETNLRLHRQLREQAMRDPLTGLHNRRFFDELKPLLLAKAQDSGQPMTAVMLDLDHFKRLNDTHGHQAGDAALRRFAALLQRGTRPGDAVFRLGGEEFLVLLPGMAPRQALPRIAEWRAMLAAEEAAQEAGRVTFSAGVAGFPGDAAGWEELLRRADAALYRAKAEGRDRSTCWEAAGSSAATGEPVPAVA